MSAPGSGCEHQAQVCGGAEKLAGAQGHWVLALKELYFPLFHTIKKGKRSILQMLLDPAHMAGSSIGAAFMLP